MDEMFYDYCNNNNINELVNMSITYPNRYYVIIDEDILINAEIILDGDFSNIINPEIFLKKFKMKKINEKIEGVCGCCLYENHNDTENHTNNINIKFVRLNCHPNHILCMDCLKKIITYSGLCPYCRDELSLMDCMINS